MFVIKGLKDNCLQGKLPPNPSSNPNPKPNPNLNLNRGGFSSGSNCPDTHNGDYIRYIWDCVSF